MFGLIIGLFTGGIAGWLAGKIMNNEEKILEMLVAMQGDISSMQGDISSIKGRLDRMDERINNIDDRSLRTAMLVENELVPKVQLLYEGRL